MKLKYFTPWLVLMLFVYFINAANWPHEMYSKFPVQEAEAIRGMVLMWFFYFVTFFAGVRMAVFGRE